MCVSFNDTLQMVVSNAHGDRLTIFRASTRSMRDIAQPLRRIIYRPIPSRLLSVVTLHTAPSTQSHLNPRHRTSSPLPFRSFHGIFASHRDNSNDSQRIACPA